MDKLDTLIAYLCNERGERPPENLSRKEKEDYFRALCNVRPPYPVGEEFLKTQDEYLKEKTLERGIVRVEELAYDENGVALWRGDITRLNADAIVNACNSALLGCFQPLHNCIDNTIHSCAGVQVRLKLNEIMRGKSEPNGRVRVTDAYNLPSQYIFHTVGPIVSGSVSKQNETDLASCYVSCLDKAEEMKLLSVAFCCLSTGVFGYPQDAACSLAVDTVLNWKQSHKRDIKVIFNVFTERDHALYQTKLAQYGKL